MIIDKTDLKGFLKIEAADHDTFITTLCGYAQAIIESYCKRNFESQSYTEKRDGDGTNLIYMRERPIISVTSISIDDVAMTDLADSIRTNLKQGAIYLKYSTFSRGFQNVEIVYTAGYAAADIPEEVEYAILEMAALLWKDSDKGAGRLGIDSENVTEAGGNRFLHKLNEMTLKGLSRYRRVVV